MEEPAIRVKGNPQVIIAEYKTRLRGNWTSAPLTIASTEWYAGAVLQCKRLENRPNFNPAGFMRSDSKWQYSIDVIDGGKQKRFRPAAWRIPFLEHDQFFNEDWTVSHLCHNDECLNWAHHVLEPLAVNKGRNGCPGGDHCHHRTKCLRPGPFFDA